MERARSKQIIVNALGACHPDCPFCAKAYFAWFKQRMRQMDLAKPGQSSFAAAAATSVKVEPDVRQISQQSHLDSQATLS